MEAVEEPPNQDNAAEGVKVNITTCEVSAEDEILVQAEVCQKSNGVADTTESKQVQIPIENSELPEVSASSDTVNEEKNDIENIEVEVPISEVAQNVTALDIITQDIKTDEADVQDDTLKNEQSDDIQLQNNNEVSVDMQAVDMQAVDMQAGDVEVDGIVETSTENVLFETEILIENNVDDHTTKYKIIYENDETDHSNNILSELGQGIELSEVLRSSDVTEHVENNNSEVTQEVFNKEELLDILEGNDVEESRKVISKNFQSDCKKLETQLALQQLSRLKQTKRTRKRFDKRHLRKSESPKDENVKKKSNTTKEDQIIEAAVASKEIVNALVKDWEDDEPAEGDHTNKVIEEGEITLKEADTLEIIQNSTMENNESKVDVTTSDDQVSNKNKNSSDLQPQRRLGRVIKKKVIFDPDNPDTFTKTKVNIKKENQTEKEQSTPKKVKVDPITPRSKSKSPILTKSQWKKPQAKHIKKLNRLSEIDKLLMDEGAVNMICQLTPEAPKGHKNMKSKAEFIKKIQSSTPNSKEMKFRERKKEIKTEDGEPRKIGSGKERLSLNNSMKSPTVSEDFEAHSADDSIIYRRHSSSSYSSSCMSPRRLSDVETTNQSVITSSQAELTDDQTLVVETSTIISDAFMAETQDPLPTSVINKKNLLSIKEKLNSKLSMALNKRKRESTKAEKPSKIKRVSRSSEKSVEIVENYKYLRLTHDQKLVEICILYPGAIFNIEVMKELKSMLESVEAIKDVSVTLLTSESGTICSGFELKPLLNQEIGSSYAQELAEAARSLLVTIEGHSKLVCTAVGDTCQGLGLSMVALSDITLASDTANFQLTHHRHGPLLPGPAALGAVGLQHQLVNELLVFERCISAADALRGGLVSRTLWPDKYLDQVRAIAKDIAAQPKENIMLKKELLRLKRGMSGSLLSDLEKERDLFVKYWTSAEAQQLVAESFGVA